MIAPSPRSVPRRPGFARPRCACAALRRARCSLGAPPVRRGRLPPKSDRHRDAIGDIHGDLDAFLGAAPRVGLIDADRRWTRRRRHARADRRLHGPGPKVRELLDFLMALEPQAAAGGGRAIVLMGNHEA